MIDYIKLILDKIPNLPNYLFYPLLILVTIYRFIDGYKYHLQSIKIRKVKTSVSQSRNFFNQALISDIFMTLWLIFKVKDTILLVTNIIAIIFVIEVILTTYVYYPYKGRGLNNFKKPAFVKYLWNSLLPNHKRKRL